MHARRNMLLQGYRRDNLISRNCEALPSVRCIRVASWNLCRLLYCRVCLDSLYIENRFRYVKETMAEE